MVSYLDNAPNYLSWVRYPKEIICKLKKGIASLLPQVSGKVRKLYQSGALLRTLAEEILSKNHIILKTFHLENFFSSFSTN